MEHYGTYRTSVFHYGHIGSDRFLCGLAIGEGFNGKDIKTGPEMGSIRENGREFGHCAEVKSVFMGALRPYFVGIRGRRIHYEMDIVQLGAHLFPAGEYFVTQKSGLGPPTLALSSPEEGKGRRIGFLGVRFYQEVNGAYHMLGGRADVLGS